MTLTTSNDHTTTPDPGGAVQSDSTAAAAPLLWMRGERTALGPFTRELAELYWQWENEPAVIAGMGRQTPESLEARLAGYDAQARSMGTIPRFTIYDLTRPGGPVPVGTSALRIDHYVRTAEFIILLGADGRGRNLATEATRLTLDYAFTISALRSVWLKVLAAKHRRGRRLREGRVRPRRATAPRRLLATAPRPTSCSWTSSPTISSWSHEDPDGRWWRCR
jgi:diamine N-acetyltransferase